MKAPSLEVPIYEAFVEVKPGSRPIDVLKELVAPPIREMYSQDKIRWYCVLFHNDETGLLPPGVKGLYAHVRMQFAPGVISKGQLEAELMFPYWFEAWREADREAMKKIAGVDLRAIKHDVTDGWMLIGMQTDCFFRIIERHSFVGAYQLGQFLHYWDNLAGTLTYFKKPTVKRRAAMVLSNFLTYALPGLLWGILIGAIMEKILR